MPRVAGEGKNESEGAHALRALYMRELERFTRWCDSRHVPFMIGMMEAMRQFRKTWRPEDESKPDKKEQQ